MKQINREKKCRTLAIIAAGSMLFSCACSKNAQDNVDLESIESQKYSLDIECEKAYQSLVMAQAKYDQISSEFEAYKGENNEDSTPPVEITTELCSESEFIKVLEDHEYEIEKLGLEDLSEYSNKKGIAKYTYGVKLEDTTSLIDYTVFNSESDNRAYIDSLVSNINQQIGKGDFVGEISDDGYKVVLKGGFVGKGVDPETYQIFFYSGNVMISGMIDVEVEGAAEELDSIFEQLGC